MKPKRPPGPPMTLGNMRKLGVQNLLASCLNDACRHTALIDVSSYPAETEIPWFSTRAICARTPGHQNAPAGLSRYGGGVIPKLCTRDFVR